MGVSWPLIAYALCNVVACGTLGVQGVLALRGHGTRVQLPAAVVALACALASGVFAALRLGRLDRFVNVFGNPSSAIARGYYAIVLLLVVVAVLLVVLRRSEAEALPCWCAVLALVSAVVGAYALAASLTATANSPAKTWLTAAYLFVVAATLGTLMCSAIGAAVGRGSRPDEGLARLGNAGVVSTALLAVLTLGYGLVTPSLVTRRAASLTTSTYGIVPGHPSGSSVSDVVATPGIESPLFWGVALGAGVLVPLVLAFVSRNKDGAGRVAASAAAGACVLAGVGVTLGMFALTTTVTKMFV